MRIVGHNAFWFQGVPFPTDRPGGPVSTVMETLVEMYLALHPDVLALQEIQDRATFEQLARAVGMSGAYAPGAELSQYGVATFLREGRLVAEGTAGQPRPQRMWQMVELPGQRLPAVRICNIHLPSSRQLGKALAVRRRVAELRSVLALPEPPAVLLGDLNEPPGGPVGQCLTQLGYLDAAVVTGQADRPTNVAGKRGDQIWVQCRLEKHIRGYGVISRGRMARDPGGQSLLSDHFPLWLDLEV